MEEKKVRKYFLIAILLVLITVGFLIIKSFISALLSAVVLTYVFFPIYKRINRKIKNETLCALIVTILILLIIIVPIIFIANTLIQESIRFYQENTPAQINLFVSEYISKNPKVNEFAMDAFKGGIKQISTAASNFVVAMPSRLLRFFIFIFVLFYLLKNGKGLINNLKHYIPLKQKDQFIAHIGRITSELIYGVFIIALIEFIIAVVGFWILDINAPLIWGLVIGFLALIPFIGPTLVWVPFALVGLLSHRFGLAAGMIVIGIILSSVDTFLRPKIMAAKTKLHPVLIVLGVFGGIPLFGIIGLIVGPLLLYSLIALYKIYWVEDALKI